MIGPPVRHLAAAVAGNALEYYDFVTYAFFATAIGQAFFPSRTPLGGLMSSLAVYGVGFAARPLGALLLGRFADRRGRVPALRLSFGLMGSATLGLVLIPDFATIGSAAPVLAVAMRLLQGFALGGDGGAATALLVEAAPPGRRVLYGAWQLFSQQVAAIVAGLIGLGLTAALSSAVMAGSGWRLAFVPGLALLPLAAWARLGAAEAVAPPGPAAPLPSVARVIAAGTGLAAAATAATQVILFMTTYATATLHLPLVVGLAAPFVAGSSTLAAALAAARVADRGDRRRVVIAGLVAMLALAWPVFAAFVASPTAGIFLGGVALLAGANAVALVPIAAWFVEQLPRDQRALTLGLVYAAMAALFGGTTQLMLTAGIARWGAQMPAVFLVLTSLVGLIAAVVMPRRCA